MEELFQKCYFPINLYRRHHWFWEAMVIMDSYRRRRSYDGFHHTQKEIDGPLNMTAPTPIRMKEFGENIATIMNKPHWLPVPSFIIQTLLGEMSILVLEGQRVLPIKAIEHGYQYTFPAIDHALQNILSHTM